jgi:fructose-1,6-bisphosphatase/inositol monophosphatase family enzyme
MKPDSGRVSALIAEISEKEIAARYRKLDPSAIRTKDGPNDLVTIVDEATEKALRSALLDLTPGAAFIGEEAAAADPAIADRIADEGRCWIVDPLDGTRNYVNGVDEFGTIVAYVENGVTTAGWIYAVPMKAVAVAVRGEGVTWKGVPVSAKGQIAALPTGLRSTGWLAPEWRTKIVENLKKNTSSRSGHCSAYAYLKLLQGEVDFTLSSRIHAWDHAAGALMLEELGGETRWLDSGSPYSPQQSDDRPLLATAPGRDWDTIANDLRS